MRVVPVACKLPELEEVRVSGKSTSQEYANWLPHGVGADFVKYL
jgi:hypothetical protein